MVAPAILGGILLAAGTVAQMAGERRAQKAVQNSLAAERLRQAEYRRQQEQHAVEGRKPFENFESERATQETQLDERFQNNIQSQVDSYLPGTNARGGNSVVLEAQERESGKSEANVREQASALAKMNSFSDAMFGGQLALQKSGQEINTLGGFARGSQAVNGLEVQEASRKGDTLKTVGGLASQFGGMMLGHGLAGGASSPSALTAFTDAGIAPSTSAGKYYKYLFPEGSIDGVVA